MQVFIGLSEDLEVGPAAAAARSGGNTRRRRSNRRRERLRT